MPCAASASGWTPDHHIILCKNIFLLLYILNLIVTILPAGFFRIKIISLFFILKHLTCLLYP